MTIGVTTCLFMQIVTASGHYATTEDRTSQLIQIFCKASEDVHFLFPLWLIFSKISKKISKNTFNDEFTNRIVLHDNSIYLHNAQGSNEPSN